MTGTDASENTEELQIETLSGDLRDAMLMRIRNINRPWSLLTEQEQREMAEGLDMAARHLVRNAVRLLNDYEWPHAVVKLHEIKIAGSDKGIEAKVSASNIEHNRSVLGENVGDYCMLLMVDSDTFMAERAPAAIDPDQPELPGSDESEAA
ncbi:hypothetical protein [Roseinatronobacter alkalisoli]|uniref:Uncharacterized protein n=1 Tax=Roseinatronobacter alkalisoli TaxID=3028235 RepID=A0ABT5THN6_9RHOB|nr:hypothetical protein [Roseinatronobacter sp. HJB301]MDD7973428.1 hypothetical protein [Roseinatronobacter sp. HJB301]